MHSNINIYYDFSNRHKCTASMMVHIDCISLAIKENSCTYAQFIKIDCVIKD